ncbi:MAG: hypothetical protein EOO68_38065 [Moraxellaceae bacterium]|nr:MAG: hypothetical protein EOO68_38065 [Moraxellaceae bacterium]
MLTIPVVLYPVIAFLFAVVVGRLGTIIADRFRKDEMLLQSSSNHLNAQAGNAAMRVAKHG